MCVWSVKCVCMWCVECVCVREACVCGIWSTYVWCVECMCVWYGVCRCGMCVWSIECVCGVWSIECVWSVCVVCGACVCVCACVYLEVSRWLLPTLLPFLQEAGGGPTSVCAAQAVLVTAPRSCDCPVRSGYLTLGPPSQVRRLSPLTLLVLLPGPSTRGLR